MQITKRQRQFADHYLDTGNAVESALSAGYTRNTARNSSYKMLRNEGVKKYLAENRVNDPAKPLQTITDLMDDVNAKPADRLRAAQFLARQQPSDPKKPAGRGWVLGADGDYYCRAELYMDAVEETKNGRVVVLEHEGYDPVVWTGVDMILD